MKRGHGDSSLQGELAAPEGPRSRTSPRATARIWRTSCLATPARSWRPTCTRRSFRRALVNDFATTAGGVRMATSVCGVLTSRADRYGDPASIRFWSRTGSPTIPIRPPIRRPPTSLPGATLSLPNGGARPRIDWKGQASMSIPSTALARRISLGRLHSGQLRAHWALQPYRFKALCCGRRFDKTEFAKTWIAHGLVQGEERSARIRPDRRRRR